MTSSPNTMQIYERRLQQLRQKFIDGLLSRILILEQQAINLRTGECDTEALAAIKGECHKLAGVASSFGFPEIGARAGEIEEVISVGKMTCDEIEKALDALMNQMEALLDTTQTDS